MRRFGDSCPSIFFEDLMANEELHFTRADGFKQDEEEGIPPEDYLRKVLKTRVPLAPMLALALTLIDITLRVIPEWRHRPRRRALVTPFARLALTA
jgi:hypothetical protein